MENPIKMDFWKHPFVANGPIRSPKVHKVMGFLSFLRCPSHCMCTLFHSALWFAVSVDVLEEATISEDKTMAGFHG